MEYIFIDENTDLAEIYSQSPIEYKCKLCNNTVYKTKLATFNRKFLCPACSKKKTCQEKYGVDNYAQSKLFHKKAKKNISYDGLYFDSSWELIFYKYHKAVGSDIVRNPISIEYYVGDKKHLYFPDFSVNGILYEIKGDHFLDKDGILINPFDESQNEKYQAKFQCMLENHVTILKSNVIKKMKEYLED